MTVIVIVDVALCAAVFTGIVGMLLWAIVTQEPDWRFRSLQLFRELRVRSPALARGRDGSQPQIKEELQ